MADQESEQKRDSGEESDDEEVLEESPCGRWQKRREEVDQRDVPGIDSAFLAMDTEEGVEVVWNEVQFSEKRDFRAQQDKIRQVFDNLCRLDHPNIIKFHKYWTDTKTDKPRVIFISEYMSSGNLKQFLKKTKKNNKTFQLKAWKRWCTQILSALSYLHSCDPPIIHGNLTTETIYIQHNGLIKIGSVAPDAIHHHVKTYSEDLKNMHYSAPEYEDSEQMTTKVDIYSFGMCALEMATLGFQPNGDSPGAQKDVISQSLELVENPLQKDFLHSCLQRDPKIRLTARELLFHKVLFEVHSLKLVAAHKIVKCNALLAENLTETSHAAKTDDPNRVIAEIHRANGQVVQWKVSQTPVLELDKLLDDVKNGIYPLTAFSMSYPPASRPRAISPEVAESVKSETPEPYDVETRMIVSMTCQVLRLEDHPHPQLTLLVRFDDQINRQLQCEITNDSGESLADDLVYHGFINEKDRDKVASLIGGTLPSTSIVQSPDRIVSPNLVGNVS
ncbi:nuclear receptor-binding protein [Aplysia californica]|uniref:Nuclear receptor-binding protein n=1 Tax=Aplysia californica TaxID=6500 RepID=A0ABM0JZD1_APLCA|nr:nuclear receptor-binding protein [Aplysia californica]